MYFLLSNQSARLRSFDILSRSQGIWQPTVCTPNPCANGGQCILTNFNTDYACQCPVNLPLDGKNCDQLLTKTTSFPI